MLIEALSGMLSGTAVGAVLTWRLLSSRYRRTYEPQVSAVAAAGESLRTYLDNILSQSQLLSARAKHYRSEDRHLVGNVIDSSGDLRRILLDTLEIVEINSKKLPIQIEETILHNTIESLLAAQRLRALRLGLTLETEQAVSTQRWYQYDETRIRQCIESILGQCFHQTRGSRILFFASVEENKRGRETLVVKIQDSGVDLQQQQVDAYFSPDLFHCNDHLSQGNSWRLSVLLSYYIAAEMGGNLSGRALPNGGVEFTLRLPIKQVSRTNRDDELLEAVMPKLADEDLRKAKRKIHEPSEVKVLIADDNETSRVILTALLQTVGYANILSACDKNDVHEYLKTSDVDVVITETSMTDIDGMELIQAIRQMDAPWSGVPIIAILSSRSATERHSLSLAGADAFIAKPILRDELTVVMAEQLDRGTHAPRLVANA